MKIRQLDILNIASIEKATIDFEKAPLKDSDVFLITGKIGAGKSTILDAICLALYGTTPRINVGIREKIEANDDGLTGRDPRQLMRQHTGEAWARLVFDGTDGNSYEAEWQVQRGTRKKPTSAMDADVWTLKNLTTGEVLAGSTNKDKGVREAIQKAVGLDFDQFCRTTMLAQGEFTKFLKSDEKEKAAILEKITGTKIYSKIGVKIYNITKEKRDALKQQTDKMSGIKLLTQEEIQEKSDRIKEIGENSKVLDKELEQALEARRDLKEVEECQAEIDRLAKEIGVQLKEQYVVGLKGKKGLEDGIQRLKDQQKTVSDRLELQKEKSGVYEQSQTIIQLLRTIYSTQQQIQQKKRGLPEVSCAEQETALKADEERLKALNLPALRTQKETLTKTVNELHNLQIRLGSLSVQNEKLQESEQQNKELWTEMEQLERELPVHQEKLKAGKELLASLETLKNMSAQTVDQWAKQIRATLKEGCTCPVCQQTLKQALPVESELDKAYQDHLKKYDDQKLAVNDLESGMNKANANLEAKKRQHGLNDANLTKFREDLQREVQKFLEDAAKHGIQTMPEAKEKLQTLKQAKEDEAFQLGLRITDAEGLERQVNEKRTQLNQLAALAELEKSVVDLGHEVDTYLGKDLTWPVDWHTDITAFANHLKEHAKQYTDDKELSKSLENQLREKDKMLQEVYEIQSRIVGMQSDWRDLETDEVQAMERLETYWNGLHAQLDTKRQLKAASEQKKLQAQQRLEALQVKDTPEALDAKIDDVKARNNALKEEGTLLVKALEDDAAQRKDKEALQERIDKMSEEVAQWKTLDDYFGSADGSKFQKIAQSFILGNLLLSANNYLQSLHPRYSLEVVPGTLHISLADAYQGYATRFVSTLSGGESFLVSLALALALADIGQNLAVDTLFIDEGFGSLSGNELTNAINTLRALHRSNGRRVGIISHIDAVKENIPVQIQVIQEGHHSSSLVKVES
ncbi:MAG: AAA family ATPase [Bacteroidales bacterium]|nr:AAA family ATPase [Bacteroidales bacterium]